MRSHDDHHTNHFDAAIWLRNHLDSDDTGGDLLEALVKDFAEALMSADASAQCQAGYYERADERANSRSGYRTRRWDIRPARSTFSGHFARGCGPVRSSSRAIVEYSTSLFDDRRS